VVSTPGVDPIDLEALGLAGRPAEDPKLLSKNLRVGRFVEPDEQRAPAAQRGRAKVAAGAISSPSSVRDPGFSRSRSTWMTFLPLVAYKLVDAVEHVERLPARDGGLLGVDLPRHRDLLFRKEPLRLGAGRSAFR